MRIYNRLPVRLVRCRPLPHYQPGPTVTVATVFPGATKADWERSVAIWREQAQDEADERRRLVAAVEYEDRKSRF
jgi:hypothetical protein